MVVELQGSLALTGKGHATPKAVVLGLLGLDPETLDPDYAETAVARVAAEKQLALLGTHDHRVRSRDATSSSPIDVMPELHPNGMKLKAFDAADALLFEQTYYSTGGGFIATEKQLRTPAPKDQIATGRQVPFPFGSGAELLEHCAREGKTVEEIVYANEDAMRPRAETDARLDRIAAVMADCIERGLKREGVLPGALEGEPPRAGDLAQAARHSRKRMKPSACSIGSTSTPWPSTKRTRRADKSSPRPPMARRASCRRSSSIIASTAKSRCATRGASC